VNQASRVFDQFEDRAGGWIGLCFMILVTCLLTAGAIHLDLGTADPGTEEQQQLMDGVECSYRFLLNPEFQKIANEKSKVFFSSYQVPIGQAIDGLVWIGTYSAENRLIKLVLGNGDSSQVNFQSQYALWMAPNQKTLFVVRVTKGSLKKIDWLKKESIELTAISRMDSGQLIVSTTTDSIQIGPSWQKFFDFSETVDFQTRIQYLRSQHEIQVKDQKIEEVKNPKELLFVFCNRLLEDWITSKKPWTSEWGQESYINYDPRGKDNAILIVEHSLVNLYQLQILQQLFQESGTVVTPSKNPDYLVLSPQVGAKGIRWYIDQLEEILKPIPAERVVKVDKNISQFKVQQPNDQKMNELIEALSGHWKFQKLFQGKGLFQGSIFKVSDVKPE